MTKLKIGTVALIMVFFLFSFTIAQADMQNHAGTGGLSTGSSCITGRGSGNNSDAGGTISTPSGYADYTGESFFTGFSLVTEQTAPGGEGLDGVLFAGGGIGEKGNSLEVTLTMADVSNVKDFFVSAKYQFMADSPSQPALSVGVEAINEVPGQLERSPFIVASKFFDYPRLPIVASLGWGAGRFGENFFGAIALIVTKQWNLIVEYDGMGGNLGTSFALRLFEGRRPIVVTVGAQDVFASEHESTFTIATGITFH